MQLDRSLLLIHAFSKKFPDEALIANFKFYLVKHVFYFGTYGPYQCPEEWVGYVDKERLYTQLALY